MQPIIPRKPAVCRSMDHGESGDVPSWLETSRSCGFMPLLGKCWLRQVSKFPTVFNYQARATSSKLERFQEDLSENYMSSQTKRRFGKDRAKAVAVMGGLQSRSWLYAGGLFASRRKRARISLWHDSNLSLQPTHECHPHTCSAVWKQKLHNLTR